MNGIQVDVTKIIAELFRRSVEKIFRSHPKKKWKKKVFTNIQ